ncbi:50S ribosomal protein L7ae [Clostridium novyi]|uniref:50S ribosomal protein L7ae n=1 Tax=Clostridium novyi TaxID=1542 RepID=UPI000A7D1F93|nr:50S ribosomal protein L7ae [Clostridium novyi]
MILIIVSLMMSVLLMGCKSRGTDKVYNDNNEISKEYDTFGIDRRKETIEDGVYKGNLKISGTNTIWQYKSDKNFNIKVSGVLSVKGGKGKIVFISPDNKVINIAEIKDKEVKEYNISVTVPIKKGLNRIKVVGYDKADVNMEIHIDEGKFQKIKFGSAKNIKENERLRNSIWC